MIKKMRLQIPSDNKASQFTEDHLEWANDAIVNALESNFLSLSTYLEIQLGAKHLIVEDDCVLSCSNIVDASFNYVVKAQFTEENAAQRVSEIIDLYRSKNVPFQWVIKPSDSPKNLSKILENSHLEFVCEDSGMYFDLRTTLHKISSKLEVKRVLTSFQLEEFEEVALYSGESPLVFQELFHKAPSTAYQESAPMEMYIGYVDDVVVATGMLFFDSGVAGIYYLATHPEYRRKGYGSAMMHALMERAKELNYPLMTLYASQDGKALYKHIGFQECCTFKEYVMEPNG